MNSNPFSLPPKVHEVIGRSLSVSIARHLGILNGLSRTTHTLTYRNTMDNLIERAYALEAVYPCYDSR